jgi:NAD(P)H-nitrite reductase large subunit
LAIIGLKEEDIDGVWEDLKLDKGAAVGLCIRSIRACPGNTYCKLGQQDALGVGLKMDAAYHGKQLPGKFKMAVSGCHLSCAESWVRDIGLIGRKDGWALVIGGNVGASPRIAQEITDKLTDEAAMAAIETVIAFYVKEAQKGERLGKMIDRTGIEPFKAALA